MVGWALGTMAGGRMNQIILGDCLEVLADLPESSIDLILTDPPYGRTQNLWDQPLNLKKLWKELYRVAKPSAPFVFTAMQPFAAELLLSNKSAFRYDWIWRKNKSTGFLNSKRAPLRAHEHVLVFCRKAPPYYPQKTTGTQKPEALFEYLIRTYTKPGAIVLDPCAGSGTTGVAARACGREFVLIDSDRLMVKVMNRRLPAPQT